MALGHSELRGLTAISLDATLFGAAGLVLPLAGHRRNL